MDTNAIDLSTLNGWFLVLLTLTGPVSQLLADLVQIRLMNVPFVVTPATTLLMPRSSTLGRTPGSLRRRTGTLSTAIRGCSIHRRGLTTPGPCGQSCYPLCCLSQCLLQLVHSLAEHSCFTRIRQLCNGTKSPRPALGTAVILVNPISLAGQQLLKRLQLNGVTKCCLHILGLLLHYFQLQLTIVKCSDEGFVAYLGKQ